MSDAKLHAPPSDDHGDAGQSVPDRHQSATIELWRCPALAARITEAACAANQKRLDRAQGADREIFELAPCRSCPGVRALSQEPQVLDLAAMAVRRRGRGEPS